MDRAWQVNPLKIVKKLYVNNILLLPRIHPNVNQDLKVSENLLMREWAIQLNNETQAIYKNLMKLMDICIDNIIFFGEK